MRQEDAIEEKIRLYHRCVYYHSQGVMERVTRSPKDWSLA